MRYIDIGAHSGMIDIVQKTMHRLDIVDERELERLQLQGDLQVEIGGVFAQFADAADAGLPLLGWCNDLALPDVLAQHQQHVLGIVFVSQVEITAAAVEVEALDAGIEVDEADGDASDADDGQAGAFAFAADETTLAGIEVERIGEDVDGVEADLL